jgi:4-hydroxy 2-oxovalerate aldolase
MWGTNLYYYLSAMYKIHPTYVQNMLSEKRYGENEIMLAIENLKFQKCKTYSPSIYKSSKIFLNQVKFKEMTENKFATV